ncbi:hypothetical protein DFP73DRAFT_564504 [Morchella snyderi]|nr:hypothetical protein DFP73DRAFT_564504 [Morchella snyderi]
MPQVTYTENPTDPKVTAKFNNKASSQYFDPCQEAADRSLRCLHRNPGDKDMCTDYFQAYRDCKKKWIEERKEEKRRQTKMTLW